MNDKQQLIIETAIKLFAQKGYHATSIQEIVDTIGIAKGSLYFYFKSKEDLLLSSIQYYYEMMMKETFIINQDKSLSPKERLQKQVKVQFSQLVDNRDFIMMIMSEQRIQVSEETRQFFFNVRAQSFYWMYSSIVEIYGQESKAYAMDGASLFHAILGNYFQFTFLDRIEFDINEVSSFLIDRLDDLMAGMMHRQSKPLLNEDNTGDLLKIGFTEFPGFTRGMADGIAKLRSAVAQLSLEPEKVADIESSLSIMEEEYEKDSVQPVIIKGMIAYLRNMNIPELNEHLEYLEAIM